MQAVFDIFRISFGLLLYLAAYILPLALVLSALVRLALGWRSNWKWLLAALLLALLAAVPNIWLGPLVTNKSITVSIIAALALIAAALHIRATQGHRTGFKLPLDIALFVIVLVYTIMNVDWVVG